MMDGQNTLLCVDKVTQSYRPASRGWFLSRPEVRPITDISLSIKSGMVLGVVGDQGAGKETLLRMILGFETPDAGHVSFMGQDFATLSKTQLRGLRPHIRSLSTQTIANLDDRLTAFDNVKAVLKAVGVTDYEEQKFRINEALRLVAIGHIEAQKYPSALSSCQRQRVAIATVIVTRPRLIVADEPAQGFDVSVQAQMLKLLLDLQDVLDLTLVISSTNLIVAGSLCDELVVLQNGQIVEAGPATRLLNRPEHLHTQELLHQAEAAEQAA